MGIVLPVHTAPSPHVPLGVQRALPARVPAVLGPGARAHQARHPRLVSREAVLPLRRRLRPRMLLRPGPFLPVCFFVVFSFLCVCLVDSL